MAAADLRLTEQEGRKVPAPIERVEQRPRDARQLRLVAVEVLDDLGDVGEQACAIELEVIGHEIEVGAAERQHLVQPMSEFHMAVSGRLGLA